MQINGRGGSPNNLIQSPASKPKGLFVSDFRRMKNDKLRITAVLTAYSKKSNIALLCFYFTSFCDYLK